MLKKTEHHEKALKLDEKKIIEISRYDYYMNTLTVLRKLKQSNDLVGRSIIENLMTNGGYDEYKT